MKENFDGVYSYAHCTYYGTFKILQQGLEENTYSTLNRCFLKRNISD